MCVCAQSCLTLSDPMDYSLPGFSVHGVFQSRKSGKDCHFLLQGNLPDPGIELESPASLALAGEFFTTAGSWEALRLS